ncbi:MAG: hypothetical protein H7343_21450 [Undibacterium sp.]|nr:hypothetical protein [Opitutaceae bacterium]
MPTKMTGDFSAYPEVLRDVIPYLVGETCELRSSWQTYKHLFMTSAARTEILGKRLGGLLGVFQNLVQDDMFVSVARLTDKDSKQQKNLTLWTLVHRCEQWDANAGRLVRAEIESLADEVADIRAHRHKRLAHFDLSVSLGQATLPIVTFNRLFGAIAKIESILNLVSQLAINTTTMFEILDHRDITGMAEVTVYKAMAYDAAEAAGVIESRAWRRFAPATSE